MKKLLSLLLAVLMVMSMFAACGGDGEGGGESGKDLANVKFDSFAVGFGAADITPDPESQIGIVGNNDHGTRLATGVSEPLGATCAAFTDTDGTTVIVFGADLHGANDELVDAIRKGIEEATGVPADHVQFNTSHNHTGPDMGTTASLAVQESNENIRKNCIQAAVDAMKSRAPATMEMTICRPENLVFCRHYLGIDGTYLDHNTVGTYQGEVIGHMEPGDNLMQLVRFKREGQRDILLVNFQGHYRGNKSDQYTMLSGDYTAVMRRELSEKANTDTVFIFGASGDSAAASRISSENVSTYYEEHGVLMAKAAMEAFDSFTPADTGKIYYTEQKHVFKGQEKQWLFYSFGFGDFGYVAEPFETFQTDGIAVREASPYKMTFYASVSNKNKMSGYAPDEKALTWNCYERGPQFSPEGSGAVIRDELIKMITANFKESGQTQKEKQEGYITDFSPKSNGVTYTNPNPGDMSKMTPVKNGYYNVTLLEGAAERTLLVETKELAEDILSRSTMKLLIYEGVGMVGGVE